MAKTQYSIYNISCDVDHGQQNLICKRAKAKREMDMKLVYVTPLLKLDPGDTKDVALRVINSIKMVESHIKTIKRVHRE